MNCWNLKNRTITRPIETRITFQTTKGRMAAANTIYQKLKIPDRLIIGKTVADGNCFFDSFRQGLECLGIIETVVGLRKRCKKFAENNPPEWFTDGISNSYQSYSIQTNTVLKYIENILKRDKRGDPYIEGRVLSNLYIVSLYIIEKQLTDTEEYFTGQFINSNNFPKPVSNVDFNKWFTVFIVNQGQNHFEPIIHKVRSDLTLTMDLHSNQVPVRYVNNIFKQIEDATNAGDYEHLVKLSKLLNEIIWNNESQEDMCVNKIAKILKYITMACKNNRPLVLRFLLDNCYNFFWDSTGLDSGIKYTYWLKALCASIKSLNLDLVELLYDRWIVGTRWGRFTVCAHEDLMDNLKRLKILLVKAHDSVYNVETSLNSSLEHLQMSINVQCLIHYNSFQTNEYKLVGQNIYKNTEGVTKKETKTLCDFIIDILCIYKKYSNIKICREIVFQRVKKHLHPLNHYDDDMCSYVTCEVYYHHLAEIVILFIVKHLHYLKRRLKMDGDVYQYLETNIYKYLLCKNKNWQFFIPDKTPLYRKLACSDYNNFKDYMSSYNINIAIQREWWMFNESLNKFKMCLETIDIDKNQRSDHEKLTEDEINSLRLDPNMRNDYSLNKMTQYLKALNFVNVNTDKKSSILIIQRIIQITGEFIKSTNKPSHLSPTIVALIKAEIPSQVIRNIKSLRNNFSKFRDGNITKRMYLESNEIELFKDVLEDLREVKKALTEVIKIHEPLLKMHMLKTSLISNTEYNNAQFSNEIKLTNDDIESIVRFYRNWLQKDVDKEDYKLLEAQLAGSKNISVKYMRFIHALEENKTYLEGEIKRCKEFISSIVSIETKRIKRIQCFRESIDDLLNDNTEKNESENIYQWEQLQELVELIYLSLCNDIDEQKHKILTNLITAIINDVYPNKTGYQNVRNFVSEYEKYNLHSNSTTTTQKNNLVHEYKGLEILAKKMSTKHFLTDSEIEYLKNNTNDICKCVTKTAPCTHMKILKKIYANIVISEKELEILNSLTTDQKTKNIISYSRKRYDNSYECLANRTNLLSSVLEGKRGFYDLVYRYRYDEKFKLLIEIITLDILNIYMHSKLKPDLEKYTKLELEYPIRNLLAHGNSFYDIYNSTIDLNFYSVAVMMFVLQIVDYDLIFQTLFELNQLGVL